MMRQILVTGAFGYVGGRVAQEIALLPDTNVILGSRCRRTRPQWLPSASVALTPWEEPGGLREACRGVDIIVHLAAMNEIDAMHDPAAALHVNGVATVRLLEAAKAEKVSRLIYLSTAHVYRSPLVGLIDEAVCPRPVHPYATSHRAAEDVVLAAQDEGALTGLVVRLSNSFGAPAHPEVNRWTLLVNDLCRQAVTTKKLVLRSAGLQRRDFIPLGDVGRAIAHLVELPREKAADGIFNLGGGWTPTVMEMATLVAKRSEAVLGYATEIQRPDPLPGERSQELDYRIEKLLATGFKLSGNAADEIDATLLLCSREHNAKARLHYE